MASCTKRSKIENLVQQSRGEIVRTTGNYELPGEAMLRQYQILFSGPLNLITREGTGRLRQWWRHHFGPGHSITVWGIQDKDNELLWIETEGAENLMESGLKIDAVMFPGRGPNGYIYCINPRKETGIVKIYEPDITVDDVIATDKKSGKEWMQNQRWRAMN